MASRPLARPVFTTHRFIVRLLTVLLLSTLSLVPEVFAQRTTASPEQAFNDAFALYADRIYGPASEAFAAFRADYPNHISAPEALYYQAEAALALGREAEAIALFRDFQLRYPSHPLAYQARLALGKFFYETGDFAQALTTLAAVLEDNPPAEVGAKALYWMGESALNLDDTEAALRYFQRAADEYIGTSTAPTALYAIAFTQVRRGRYDEAARAFELLGARHPSSPYARNIGLALAEVYYELGDFRRAASEIERRLPELSVEARERAIFLLAESYNQVRDSGNAIVNYRKITEQNPDSPYFRRAVYGLAWNYHFEGAYQWSAEQFGLVADGMTDDLAAEATYYQGVNRKLASEPMAAVGLWRSLQERWPNHALAPQALYEQGITHYEQRQWDEANATFALLLNTYPNTELRGEALNFLGNTYIALNDFNQAQRAFDAAIAMDAAPQELKQEIAFQKAWLDYRNNNFTAASSAFMQLYNANPTGERAGSSLFWAAESFYQQGAHDRAIELFRNYLRQYPDGEQATGAHYALGWAFFKKTDYTNAITSFETFLSAYREDGDYVPYRTDALLRLADSYYALRRYPEAIRTYNRVAASGEDEALYQSAQARANLGDAFEAISLFREFIAEYPGSEFREEAQYSLGYLFFLNQEYDAAIDAYNQLIALAPTDPLAAKAQYGIGDALFNAGRYEAALDGYYDVLRRYPNSPFTADAAVGIQQAGIALGDTERATGMIDAFIAANPNAPIVDVLRFRQAEVLYQAGDAESALSQFQQFIRTARDTELLSDAYFYLGTIFLERDMQREAESYLSQLVSRYPNSGRRAEAANQLGNLYLSQSRPGDALQVFRAMESSGGIDARSLAQARYGQSVALLSLGRIGEAEVLLRDAINSAPDAPETALARLGMARIQEERGQFGEAATLYRSIIQQSPDEAGAEALVRLGNVLLNQGNPTGAIDELGRLETLFAGYPNWVAQGLLIQARSFTAMGQTGEANRLYDKIINEYFDTPHVTTAEQEKARL